MTKQGKKYIAAAEKVDREKLYSPLEALDLAKARGTSAKLWMNLQATYDLDQAMKRRKAA